MKKFLLFALLIVFAVGTAFSQKTPISGVIKDAESGETLVGASVSFGNGVGTVTDIDGNFMIEVDNGTYSVQFSFAGYENQTQKMVVSGKPVKVDIALESPVLKEVTVVADVARSRQTPVAFVNVLPAKIEEQLAGRDLPMVLNATPGVYATQQGGGDGDARISIRGFSQRNVAVMLDGIPVNDMENGAVYWSNWFGLDAVTRTIQVQRGLGASKLSIPSVGGTINILSKGIDDKRGGNIKQYFGSDMALRTSIGLTSGKLANGWGFTAAATYKTSDGWADATWSKGWFYFVRIDKRLGKHLISLTGMGAPQEHGQRSYTQKISTFSKDFASNLSSDPNSVDYVDTTGSANYGLKYNQNWGYLERWSFAENGVDTIHADRVKQAEKINYYHKPQFSLKDLWTLNKDLSVTSIAYLSIGNGGGVGIDLTPGYIDGQMDFQSVYDANMRSGLGRPKGLSTNVLRSSVNNHFWYGFLSNLIFNYRGNWTFSGGIDLRNYKGEHYREVYDLLGGQFYYNETSNKLNNNSNLVRRIGKGDKMGYFNDGLVRWGGFFGQAEYKQANWSTFVNISSSESQYKRVDYFAKKMIEISDTTLRVGLVNKNYGMATEYELEQITYKGKTYTINSPEAKTMETPWKTLNGYTFKVGANYNVTSSMNLFLNMGYLSRAPQFNRVWDNNNRLFRDIRNEIITAAELGFTYSTKIFSTNANFYYTVWKNKPIDFAPSVTIDGTSYSVNINGMAAIHKGLELDFIYKPITQIEIEGSVSLGDWKWNSADTAYIYDDNGLPVINPETGNQLSNSYDAIGVHVSDAAQTQFATSIRYNITKKIFIKGMGTYFGNYYAAFDPLSLNKGNEGRDSWKVPAYFLFDINFGYRFKISKFDMGFNFNVLNVLETEYISDATNNAINTSGYATFDAKSSAVFFGMGRRFMSSLVFNF